MISIIKYIWKNRSFFQLLLIIILFVLLLQKCNQQKIDGQKTKQNLAAVTEKMKVIELKNGELLSQKAISIVKFKELEQTNSELYKIAEDLKKNGYKPEIITLTKFVFIDSGSVNNHLSILKDDQYSLDFNYKDSDSILSIKGKSYFMAKPFLKNISSDGKYNLGINISSNKTLFEEIKIKTGLVVGIQKDKDGIERVFAKSEPFSNKIMFENIDATQIENYYNNKYKDSRSKKFSIGPSIGYGVILNQKGLNNGLYIGFNINYSIIKF